MSRYADYDDLIRDLDNEGMSDDPFGGGFDDEDLALLGALGPGKAGAKRKPATPARKPAPKRKPAAKKPKAA